ncbi:uncharacterized protein N7500_010028 [Penicillium coprophilum]|uniref:uncharacterized protein n=1 Tax=Penicillium coprophilum TaxID=36646 RepID=UPI00238744CD|nr:uncharacterized protein N7500_010028 [Penicillium coprophilum]KAJ5154589.1 hypothetical protein N7500_010028 [Penicillium coprophilum]
MVYPFNDEQWRRASGSVTSSGWTGTENDDYLCHYSSAEGTSLGSDLPQQDSGWINPELNHRAAEPPQRFASDLDGIDLKYYLPDENIPQNLEEDLGSSIITQRAADDKGDESNTLQPSQPVQTLPKGIDRATMGIPSSDPFALQPSLDGVMSQVVDAYRALTSGQSSPEQVPQALQNLETIKNFFHTKLPAPPISPNGSAEPESELFRCWQCNPKQRTIYPKFAVFRRHLTGHGILECEWLCNEHPCTVRIRRRDRMLDHLIRKHNRVGVPRADVDAMQVKYAPPAKCPICSDITPSWRVFFKHIRDHCLVSPGSGNASTNGDQSRRDDNNGGNGGGGNGHNPFVAGPSNPNREPSNQFNNWIGSAPYSSTIFGDFASRSNAQPGPILQSVSDDQVNNVYNQRPNNVIGEHSAGDMPLSPFQPTAHFPRGAGGQPQSQPPQNPRMPRSNPSIKRKRSDKQKEPTKEKAPDPNKCRRCKHPMATCQLCKSVRGCHECGDMSRGGIQGRTSSTMPAPALPDPSPAIYNLDESYLNPLASFEMPQNMPTQPSTYYDHNEMMQFADLRSYGGMPDAFMGTSNPDDSFMMVAAIPASHPTLSDLGGKVQESFVSESDTRLLRSIGLGRSDDSHSIKGQAKEMREKAFGGPEAPGLHTDLAFRTKSSSVTLENPQLVSPCQSSGLIVPTVHYKAHTSLQLSQNERVEMSFQMTPERGSSSHPLRTRVRVFVKLFTLRASAARSKYKERAGEITSETMSDDDSESDSDLDSDQVLTLTSSSGFEIPLQLYWTEDVEDQSLGFDIKWILLKLAQWTSCMDADTCHDLLPSDTSYALELITIYILYMLKVSWLSAGRKGLNRFLII